MHWKWIKPLLLCGVVLLAALGCMRGYQVATHPFVHAQIPDDFPKLPLRVALIKTPAMEKISVNVGEEHRLGEALGRAAFQGLFDAARLSVRHVEILDQPPAAGFDLICTPTNPYFQWRKNADRRAIVQITMEVMVREVATGKEWGLLLEAEGRPGRRPAVPIEYESLLTGEEKQGGVTGAIIRGSRFEEAINNALFYLALDFADKLRKRGEKILPGNARR